MTVQGHVDIISHTEISGWALDWDQQDTPIEVSVFISGVEVGRCSAEILRPGLQSALGRSCSGRHAFHFRFPTRLDDRRNQHVEVRTSDKQVLLPNGRRTLFGTSAADAAMTPIVLTSGGRSGTTLLMQEFAAHPEIAVANIYPFEVKLLSYYASVLNVLSASTAVPSEVEVDFGVFSEREMVVGRNPWNRQDVLRATGGRHALRLFGSVFPGQLSHLLRSTIEEYYGTMTEAQHATPRFFAEKGVLEESVRRSSRQLYPNLREIVLVRDPRDYLCSAQKFWKQDLEAVLTTMGLELPVLMAIHDAAPAGTLFVRYEDLLRNGEAERTRMNDFIGCESRPENAGVHADAVPDSHRTSRSPEQSIGRFRTELDPAILDTCQQRFGRFMAKFDYT